MDDKLDSPDELMQPGKPIKPETISRWRKDLPAAWEKISPCYIQPKYDGWQIQIHILHGEVFLFHRRSLKNVTSNFQSIAEAARIQIDGDSVILDSEMVAFDPDTKRLLPATSVTKSLFHKGFVFDVLYVDGEDWTKMPYKERLVKVNEIVRTDQTNVLEPTKDIFVEDLQTLTSLYERYLNEGFEGIIIKSPDAIYRPGTRTAAKIKIKKWEPLDVVILGCRLTNDGRKIKQLHVGMKEKEGDKNLVKLGTIDRLDNNEVIHPEFNAYLLAQLEQTKVGQQSLLDELVFQVEPSLVVEIKSLLKRQETKDKRIIFTLENPQFICLREDKGPEDANTIEEFQPE